MRVDTAVIMAGGKGSRVASLTKDLIPKPMLRINGKPILEHQIENLGKQGVCKFYICISHLGDSIKNYFGDGDRFGVSICYFEEKEPLGSAGALLVLKDRLPEFFYVVFGDTVFDVSLARMEEFFFSRKASLALLVHPNSHPFDSDLVLCGDDDCFMRFFGKSEPRGFYYDNLVNSSFYLFGREALLSAGLTAGCKIDMEKELIPHVANAYCYRTSEYIKDAGTVDRISIVEEELKKGIPHSRNLDNRQRAIFLDRDGTVNRSNGFVKTPDEFELVPCAADAIKVINQSGYLAIVVTNQPVVARGECSMQTLCEINRKMQTELGRHGAYLDDILFCPHHPDSGFEGEIKELKIDCNCRKPKTGLLEIAQSKFNIDLAKSFFIGDGWRDIKCGINAGCRTVFLGSPEGLDDCRADYYADDILEAVNAVLSDNGNKK